MRRDGRVQTYNIAGLITRAVCILTSVKITTAVEYGVPIEIKLWDTGRTPLSHMVDVTNGFGLKVLAEHNFLNDNNIAFSPYGLMGIMVALYEGVDGEASYQIQRAMQLPWNRNVMRIGFRDIHRTLKTYFVPEEGFLAGLALNNENVTFNEQYKKILRFYGFDLENDQLPTMSPATNNTTNATTLEMSTSSPSPVATTVTIAMTTEGKPIREDSTTPSTKEETTRTVPTTNPNVETISTTDMRGVTSTTISPSLAQNAEDTSISSTVTATEQTISERTSEITTQIPLSPETEPTMTTLTSTTTTSASAPSTLTAVPTATTDILAATTTDVPTATTFVSTMATAAETQSAAETFSETSQITSALTSETAADNEVSASTMEMNTVQPATQEMIQTASTADSTTLTSTILMESTPTEAMPTVSETQSVDQNTATTENAMTTTVFTSVTEAMNESTLETLERRKKSIVDFIFTNPPYIDDNLYYRSFDIGSEIPNPNTDKMFLANGLRNVQVTYMRYDTVLEHAYLPHLEASALRLPLDSDRYYLLVILPNRGGAVELSRLLARMARESDLSDVYSVLRPRRIKGIVPSFIVKGHVTLTTDLQKLGIRDVFEPRQRDFTPMTQQAGVYVRSIEQAVSVAIRKYRPDDQKKNRYVTNREPVVFSATYPFLYFVMDATIHVALMAGKMVDPLNSRIL